MKSPRAQPMVFPFSPPQAETRSAPIYPLRLLLRQRILDFGFSSQGVSVLLTDAFVKGLAAVLA